MSSLAFHAPSVAYASVRKSSVRRACASVAELLENRVLLSTYYLSGPASGEVARASSDFTVALDGATISGTVRITPAASNGDGAFSPAYVDLTNTTRSATFTYTPARWDVRTISVTNNGGLADPSGVSYLSKVQLGNGGTAPSGDITPDLGGFNLLANGPWLQEIGRNVRGDAVDPNSAAILNYIGVNGYNLYRQFGVPSGLCPPGIYPEPWQTSGGQPFSVVPGDQPLKTMTAEAYWTESDVDQVTRQAQIPIPSNPVIQGWYSPTGAFPTSNNIGDAHMIILVRNETTGGIDTIWETWQTWTTDGGATWHADSVTKFDLTTGAQRRDGYTSGDVAGLPIAPLNALYPEVAAAMARGDNMGVGHPLRATFGIGHTQNRYVWPAKHGALNNPDPLALPFGGRLRLTEAWYQANKDSFSGQARVVVDTLYNHGMINTDGGIDWAISGNADDRWDAWSLTTLSDIPRTAFEVLALDPMYTLTGPTAGAVGVAHTYTLQLQPAALSNVYQEMYAYDNGVMDPWVNFHVGANGNVFADSQRTLTFTYVPTSAGTHVVEFRPVGLWKRPPGISFTVTTGSVPASPSALTATAVSASQINLTWADNASDEAGFYLDRATDSGFGSNLVTTTLGANVTGSSATGLTANTTYYFRVRAYNASGSSANSSTISATIQNNTTISTNTTWSGNVTVFGSVTVQNNAILSISPGTVVTFSGSGAQINITAGQLLASGTSGSHIQFNGSSTGRIIGTPTSVALSYVDVNGLGAGTTFDSGATAWLDVTQGSGGVSIQNCLVQNSGPIRTGGAAGAVTISGSDIRNLGDARLWYSAVTIQNSKLQGVGSSTMLWINTNGNVQISGNVIVNVPVWARGDSFPAYQANKYVITNNYIHQTTSGAQYGILYTVGDITNNVIRGCSWSMYQTGGKITGNVLEGFNAAETAARGNDPTHEFIYQPKNGAVIEHNIMINNAYGGIMGGDSNLMSNVTIRNNTFDMKIGYTSPVYMNHLPTGSDPSGLNVRNNLFLRSGPIYDEAANIDTLAYADYNLFDGTSRSPGLTGGTLRFVGVQMTGKVEGADGFGMHDVILAPNNPASPVTVVANADFALSGSIDTDMLAGTYTPAQILAQYREAYTPMAGSALIDAGSPADASDPLTYGARIDIGAVEFTPGNIPTAPSALVATAASSSQIDVSWTDNSLNETGFYLDRATDSGFSANLVTTTLGANVSTLSVTGLTAVTTYYFRVRAYNASGSSADTATASATTQVAAPTAPSALTATMVSLTQIDVSWTDNSSNETGFYLDRATDSGFSADLVTTTLGANVTAFSNTGLSVATTYYFRVRAYNAGGSSANTNTASATTQTGPVGLLAYDGFDYTVGQAVAGQNGGTGWASAWTSQTAGRVVASSLIASAPADTLLTTGAKITVGANDGSSSRTLSQTLGADGTTIWSSILMKLDFPGEFDWSMVVIGNLRVKAYSYLDDWSAAAESGFGTYYFNQSFAPAVAGNTYFLVVKQTFGVTSGQDNVQIYLNPTPGTEPSVGQALINTTIDSRYQDPFSTITLLASYYSATSFDEVRIGTTYADVAPMIGAAPTDISLSASSIAENQPSGTAVGSLSTIDPDAGDTFTYSLVSGTGSTDNASFTISGNQLLTATSFDFETKSSYSIRVRTTDQGGLFYEKVFTITVTDVDEIAPTVTAVYVRGSSWASGYLSFLAANTAGSSSTYGYAIPVGTGAAQLQTLPWRNLNRISLRFSEDVSIAQAQFAIVGSVGSYSVSGFSYSSSDHVATWSLSAAIGPDKLYVALPGSGASPIADLAGNVLDGEWVNPTSYSDASSSDTFPSGNGSAGGNFAFRFDVLPGDSSGGSLGKVNVADVAQTKSRSSLPVSTSTYRSDFDGNNLVNVADVAYVKSKSSVYSLPVNPPVVPVFGSAFSQVSPLLSQQYSLLGYV